MKPDNSMNEQTGASRAGADFHHFILGITLHVTDRCNLRCVYCYENGQKIIPEQDMKIGTATAAVDWLIKKSGQCKTIGITFFGGEPLMNFPVIRDTVKYAKSAAGAKQKSILFKISTNATLLTPAIIRFLKENDVETGISLDGPGEIQDKQRPFRNGKGSYNRANACIPALLNAIPEASCNSVVLNENATDQVIEEIRRLGFNKYGMAPPTSIPHPRKKVLSKTTGEFANSLFIRAMLRDCDPLLQSIKRRDTAQIRSLMKTTPLVGVMELIVKPARKQFVCGAGRICVAISTRGDIFPCHRFVGINSFRLGDVFQEGLARHFDFHNNLEKMPACRSCIALHYCKGGCFHNNFIATGDHQTPARTMCEIFVETYKAAERLVNALCDDDIGFMFREKLFRENVCTLDFGPRINDLPPDRFEQRKEFVNH